MKDIIRNISLIGFTNIAGFFSGLILLPILTKTLPIEDFGNYILIIATITLIPPIIMLGLPYTMIRYLSVEKNLEKIQEGFYSITYVIIFTALITAFLLIIFSNIITTSLFNGNTSIIPLLSLILIFECFINLFLNYFRTFQKIKIYSIFSILQKIVQLIFILIALSLDLKIIGILSAILITDFLISLAMSGVIISEIGIIIPKFYQIPTFLKFGLPTVPGNFSNWIVSLSNRYFIGIFLGVAFVGYFAPAYTLGFFIDMLSVPFAVVLPAVLSQHFDNNQMEDVRKILQYCMNFFLFLAIPAVFGLTLLSYPLIKMLSTPEIAEHGHIITGFAAVSSLLLGIYSIIFQILILKKQTHIVGMIWIIIAILNFMLNICLIPIFGLLGAGIATLISYSLLIIVTSYYSLRDFQLHLNIIYYFKIVLASILMSVIILLSKPDGIISIFTTIGISILFYTGLMLSANAFSREEIKFIKSIFNEFKK